MDKVVDVMRDVKDSVWKHRKPIGGFLIAFIIIMGVLWAGAFGLSAYLKSKEPKSGFLDYMPDVPRPCPSDYRCGGVSREQVRMEKHLFSDLREGSKYALPETMTMDAYDVTATEAEPTSCMVKRAARGREMPQPEGQYTPWDEIESGFLVRKTKKSVDPGTIKTLV
jgi:hypothetical protein